MKNRQGLKFFAEAPGRVVAMSSQNQTLYVIYEKKRWFRQPALRVMVVETCPHGADWDYCPVCCH